MTHEIAIPSITGGGVDHQALLLREMGQRPGQRFDRRGIVAVVDHAGRAIDINDIEPARIEVEVSLERLGPQADQLGWDADGPGRGNGGERVFDVEFDAAAIGQRDAVDADDGNLVTAGRENHIPFADEHGAATRAELSANILEC